MYTEVKVQVWTLRYSFEKLKLNWQAIKPGYLDIFYDVNGNILHLVNIWLSQLLEYLNEIWDMNRDKML